MNLTKLFEQHALEVFEIYNDSLIKQSMLYSFFAPGKRVRPLLMLKLISDYGLDPFIGLDGALALEMIHTYSLVHDDLPSMDNDSLRRGLPTNHVKFGEANAMLGGDALLTGAFEVLSRCSLNAENRVKCIQILSSRSGANGMVLGQYQDLSLINENSDFQALSAMYSLKTGELLSAALEMGAIIANQNEHIFALREIGLSLGLAFQIQDDLLEVTLTDEAIGKSTASDRDNHKVTAIRLLGQRKAEELIHSLFDSVTRKISELNLDGTELLDYIQELLKRQK